MAYTTHTPRDLGAATLGQRLGAARGSLAERFARYRTYRRTLNELAQLSDRDLADLGISRFDVQAIARDAAYGA